jgi:hypothetical protein
MTFLVWLKSLFCQHIGIALTTAGPASVSIAGEVYMTIELSCADCGYINHRPLDATAAMHEAVKH